MTAGSTTHRITIHRIAVKIVLIVQLGSSQEEAQWCVAAVHGSKRGLGHFSCSFFDEYVLPFHR